MQLASDQVAFVKALRSWKPGECVAIQPDGLSGRDQLVERYWALLEANPNPARGVLITRNMVVLLDANKAMEAATKIAQQEKEMVGRNISVMDLRTARPISTEAALEAVRNQDVYDGILVKDAR